MLINFYPRSPCGERPTPIGIMWGSILFLSTLSLRRATPVILLGNNPKIFLSTLSLRRATAAGNKAGAESFKFLSTLSLRRATEYWVGGYGTANNFYPRSPCGERLPSVLHSFRPHQISIHALLAESDLFQNQIFFHHSLFLSTLSLRRATLRKVPLLGIK